MTSKVTEAEIDNFVRLRSEGHTIQQIADKFGRYSGTVSLALRARGVTITPIAPTTRPNRRIQLPEVKIAAAYVDGMSVNALAKQYGVSRNVIAKRLEARGIPLRGQSEAEYVKWSQMTPEERERQVSAAHEAVRGTTVSYLTKLKTAQTVQANGGFHSPYESQLHDLLLERGIETIPQMAIGPYNCDLGTAAVAVEVFGGYWHWTGRHLARLDERVDYLFNAGFHVLVVQQSNIYPITAETADYVAAYIQAAGRDPAVVREYRVIRGAGQTIATARSDSDDRALVPTFTVTTDALGRYVSTPD